MFANVRSDERGLAGSKRAKRSNPNARAREAGVRAKLRGLEGCEGFVLTSCLRGKRRQFTYDKVGAVGKWFFNTQFPEIVIQ
jgi:hypothetical protein